MAPDIRIRKCVAEFIVPINAYRQKEGYIAIALITITTPTDNQQHDRAGLW